MSRALAGLVRVMTAAIALSFVACGATSDDGDGDLGTSTSTEAAAGGTTTQPGANADEFITEGSIIVSAQLVAAASLTDGTVQIIDARPAEESDAGHIPGAISLPVASLTVTRNGILKMAAAAPELVLSFGEAGVSATATVIVYDTDGGKVASRLFWLLEYMGHPDVRFLDGGLAAWMEDGHPLTIGRETHPSTEYPLTVRGDRVASAADIEQSLGDGTVVVIDARSEDEFAGIDVRADLGGHIPGAISRDWTGHVGSDGRLLTLFELREYYADTGVVQAKSVIVYCQSGQRATHTYLVLRAMGLENVSLYDGSWVEWGNTDRPVETETTAQNEQVQCDVDDLEALSRANLRGCDLSGRDLSEARLTSADLSGAILTDANLQGANMSGANLSGADLGGADLGHADLSRASLVGAHLSGANLMNAYLRDTDLAGVEWGQTTCPDGTNSDDNDGTCVSHLTVPYDAENDPCG